MKAKIALISAIIFALTSMYVAVSKAEADTTIKVYSERQPFLIKPLIDQYEQNSGNKIEWIFSKKGLVQKTILEKDNPVADIFLSADIARLIDIAEAGANVDIPIQDKVPANLQTQDWTSLTMRTRVIYAHNKLNLNEISYEDLILPEYKGRVCTRSGFHPYNVSLFSGLIAHHGEEWFEDYIVKLKANLARKPQGNDRDQIKAKNYDASLDFLEFLLSDEAQEIYANDNNEFPVNPNVSASERVQALANNAKFDPIDLQEIASNRKAVLDILQKINYDG